MNTMLLSLSYWIHLITTVLWLGGIVTLVLVALPAWRNGTLNDNQWLDLQKRLIPYINGSIALIWISGFIQMTTDEHYTGFLSIDGTWAAAMLAKHIAILALMLTTFYIQFRLHPNMERQKLLGDKVDLTPLHTQEKRLLYLNLLLASMILLLTAVATAV